MNAPNDNTTAKDVRGWWLSTPRSGPHRLISPWEYRHLGASGATRAAAGGFQLGIGLVLLSLGHKAETDQERRKMYRLSAWFLVPAAGNLAAGYWYSTIASSASALKLGDMRLLLAALLATLSLTGCANAGSAPRPASTTAAGAPAASAPFYLQGWQGTGPQAVSVINGFTGQVEAAIAVPKDAGSFPWMGGRKEWYPCGAAPDDRTFLLCDTDQYYVLRLSDDGKPQPMTAPADIPVAARNTGSNGDPEFAVSSDARLAAVTAATGGIMVLSLVTGATRSWTIPSADGYATGLSWAGDRYVAFQFVSQPGDSDAGGVRVLDTRSAATAALPASRLIISNERKLAGGISGVFNPVITPDGAKILAAAWTSFNVAELAEFSARTGRLLAVLMPAASMPGHGSPCQVLWTDLSGAHLIAYCGAAGVLNGTHFTPVHLHVPDTSGTDFTGLLW